MNKSIRTLAAVLAMAATNVALAASPVGQWNVTFYLEPGLAQGATQGICYLGNRTWYSTTFANWNGDWFQKGDRLRWYGDTGTLGTAEFGQFVSNAQFTGEFAHFLVPGAPPVTSSRGNYLAVKRSSTCAPPAAASASQEALDADPSSK